METYPTQPSYKKSDGANEIATSHAMRAPRNDDTPDTASDTRSEIATTLDRVGMTKIELPVLIADHKGALATIPARVDLFVSLDDPHAKGIHMSRLYLKAKEFFLNYPLSFPTLASLSEALIETHQDLSFSSHVAVSFEYIMRKPALVSDVSGYRFYPVTLSVIRGKDSKLVYELDMQLLYSSTCPCSAALARQLVQERFREQFVDSGDNIGKEQILSWLGSEDSQSAVPHAQRSTLDLKLRFKEVSAKLNLDYWINKLEDTLTTPVQAAVKREDEQEFARLNGQNMMFSEDAARRLKLILDQEVSISDYKIEVEHMESLHAHNAKVVTTKGLHGGYQV